VHFLELLQEYGWRSSKLARLEEFDHLALVTESYPQPRHYAPRLSSSFDQLEIPA